MLSICYYYDVGYCVNLGQLQMSF